MPSSRKMGGLRIRRSHWWKCRATCISQKCRLPICTIELASGTMRPICVPKLTRCATASIGISGWRTKDAMPWRWRPAGDRAGSCRRILVRHSAGSVDEQKAGRVVQRLMKPDLFNGWGIRTLSYKERRYNPMGYHMGTVWPARQFVDRSRLPSLWLRQGGRPHFRRAIGSRDGIRGLSPSRIVHGLCPGGVWCACAVSRCLSSAGVGRRVESRFWSDMLASFRTLLGID